MNHQSIAAELEFLEWRDEQLSAVHEQLQSAFPALVSKLEEMVQHADRLTLVRSTLSLRSSSDKIIRDWSAEQSKIACAKASEQLDIVLEAHGGSVDLQPGMRDQVSGADASVMEAA